MLPNPVVETWMMAETQRYLGKKKKKRKRIHGRKKKKQPNKFSWFVLIGILLVLYQLSNAYNKYTWIHLKSVLIWWLILLLSIRHFSGQEMGWVRVHISLTFLTLFSLLSLMFPVPHDQNEHKFFVTCHFNEPRLYFSFDGFVICCLPKHDLDTLSYNVISPLLYNQHLVAAFKFKRMRSVFRKILNPFPCCLGKALLV